MFEATGAGLSTFVRLWSGVGGREGGSWMRLGAGVGVSSAILNWSPVEIESSKKTRRVSISIARGCEFVVAV